MKKRPSPVVVLFSAADPTCGAGIFADVRAVAAQGCVPLAVVCGVAPQNLDGVISSRALSATDILAQFSAVRGAKLAAVKIGALMSPASAEAVAKCLDSVPRVPVVWDPVLSPTRGVGFACAKTAAVAKARILPRALVMTPNLQEARALAGGRSIFGPTLAARKLMALGAGHVLVTNSERRRVQCMLYGGGGGSPLWRADCLRVAGRFHGTGCFFASTLASRLALGDAMKKAAERAHMETLSAISRARALRALGKQKLIGPGG